jgi:hypothetical protein
MTRRDPPGDTRGHDDYSTRPELLEPFRLQRFRRRWVRTRPT